MLGLLGTVIGCVATPLLSPSINKVTEGATQVAIKNLEREIPNLLRPVDDQLNDLLNKTDYVLNNVLNNVLNKGIPKAEGAATNVIDIFFKNFLSSGVNLIGTAATAATKTIITGGITTGVVGGGLMIGGVAATSYLINKVEKKYQDNLRITLEAVDQARRNTISDLRNLAHEIDNALEKRIDQIALLVMQVLTRLAEIADQFTPEAFREKLVKPTLEDIKELEKQFFEDLDRQINNFFDRAEELRQRVEEMLSGSMAEVQRDRNLRRKHYANLALTDVEVYRLIERDNLAKLNETATFQIIVDTYGQIQLEAIRTVAIFRQSPSLRKAIVKDWLKYGMLCDFWLKVADDTSLLFDSFQDSPTITRDNIMSLTPIEVQAKAMEKLEAERKQLEAERKQLEAERKQLEAAQTKIDEKTQALEKALRENNSCQENSIKNKPDVFDVFHQ